jgi:hypothetical protein
MERVPELSRKSDTIYLSSRCPRQFCKAQEALRHHVARDPSSAMMPERRVCECSPRSGHYCSEQAHLILGVSHWNGGGVGDIRVVKQGCLHIAKLDPIPTHLDHRVAATDQRQVRAPPPDNVARTVEAAGIFSLARVVCQCRAGSLRIRPIPLKDASAPHPELSLLSKRGLAQVIRYDKQISIRTGNADRQRFSPILRNQSL